MFFIIFPAKKNGPVLLRQGANGEAAGDGYQGLMKVQPRRGRAAIKSTNKNTISMDD